MPRFAQVLLLVLALSGLALAGETQVQGTVQGIDSSSRTLTVSSPQGWQRVWVQRATDVERRGTRVDWSRLRQGDQVTVTGVTLDDGRLVASRIEVGQGGSGGGSGSGGASALNPTPGSRISSTRPTIRANFGDSLTRVRLWVDGTDFSNQAQVSGGTVSWTPNYDLDSGEHTVRLEAANLWGASYPANWSFRIVPQDTAVQVGGYAPGPGTYVTVLQPTVSAEFSGPVNRRTIRFYIDGRDFTPQVQVSGNRVTWRPAYTLDYGTHTARLEALTPSNQRVEGTWNFVITR